MPSPVPRSTRPEHDELAFDTILVRQSDRGYNLYSLESFLALPVDERIEMILDRRIRFLDGEKEVSPYAALDSLERHRRSGRSSTAG